MIPTIVFIIISSIGILSTVLILRHYLNIGGLSEYRNAIILSLGFGVTMTLSFYASLIAPGANVNLDLSLIIFGVVHAIIWMISLYVVTRLLLKLLRKK